jgi:succinyldiaminopimelate transaminase
LIDFGMGDPNEPTPQSIRRRLAEAIPERAGYPAAWGLPSLRRAMAQWVRRRFEVRLDPDRHLLPSNGSKEVLYLLHQAVIDPRSEKRNVLIPDPSYPVYRIGTLFAGGIPVELPLDRSNGFLPDLDAIPESTLEKTALLWLNYPHNPTGAVAQRELYEKALACAAKHRFWVASDEAYSEIWFEDPPPSALQVGLEGLIVVNTLSKRSAMTGYRSGMIAGDPDMIGNLRRLRPSQGVATPTFIQEAAIAAWSDEEHVAEQRASYRAKREIILPVLRRKQLRIAASQATFYLWIEAPEGEGADAFASRLLEGGIVVTPGSFFGSCGEGYIRMALVPTVAECERAAKILERLLC